MYRGAMYRKPKYGQNDTVWVERGAKQPLEKNLRDAVSNPEHLSGSSGCDVRALVFRDHA